MTNPNPITLAYELMDSELDYLGRDGFVAIWSEEDTEEDVILVTTERGIDAGRSSVPTAIHTSDDQEDVHRFTADEVENTVWSVRGGPSPSAETPTPVAEFCQ